MQEKTSNEEQWVELSADMICGMVSFGDRKFSKLDQSYQAEAMEREQQKTKPVHPRRRKSK